MFLNLLQSLGCSETDAKLLDSVKAPFDCMVVFDGEVSVLAQSLLSARSAFYPSIGRISRMNFSFIKNFVNGVLNVSYKAVTGEN